ncbi:MOSC domain-containing protein [Prosthecobacter dejongeii]|uniref:MOSC domain-containing protein YiiM n=1 Tax=Prosthecobacter dejongeii TaxID=48465 RepID=A0A7W7YIS7_9BACT|nr:MOSC domain-containing protein [Prosthecobacter dejongeii]MBB5036983.1 MOSC domain-containing protein YiiM [Prosthecobacter dejongeii]
MSDEPAGTRPFLEALFISPARGLPMQRVSSILAVAGRGLEGDRYALGTGYYSGRYDCEVSLIEGEVLDRISQEDGVLMSGGEHRRNLVTRGLALRSLEGQRLRLGDVLLEYHRPRPPCDYLQRLTVPGMTKSLGRGAGIGMRVLEGGLLEVGMEIQIITMSVKPRPSLP